MHKFEVNKLLLKDHVFYITGISLTTIAMAPWWISDGFNVPKLFFLAITAFIIIPSILSNKKIFIMLKFRNPLFLTLMFPLNLVLVFILNDANKMQQLFGELGRRTGLVTYLSCYLIFLYAALKNNNTLSSFTLKIFLYIGLISATYGILQPYGILVINGLVSKNMKPYSFFGNIDFNSGFLGLVTILLISKLIFNTRTALSKFFTLITLSYIYIAIYLTRAQQGFLVSFSGFIILFLIYVYTKHRKYFKFILFISLFLLIQFILSLFNRGYFAKFIYDSSVQARNFYWKAGWEMTTSNPALGIGLDRYSDWYWAYRDKNTIKALGPDDFTTSAHNIFLDISSSGGFPLLITYLILMILVFAKGLSELRKMETPNYVFITLFSSWIGFITYSLVGIGQIGILIWGWIFAGLILGWNLNLQIKDNPQTTNLKINRLISLALFITGIILTLPMVKDSYSIKNAMTINSPKEYLNFLENNKIEPSNISRAIIKLNELGLESESLDYLRTAIINFPNNYELWTLQYSNKYSTLAEKQIAYENLLRLNYYNKYLAALKSGK
jgi:O-antigen ligase